MDFRSLLAAVEEAPPIDVVDVLAEDLANAVGAGHVALLIANFSGSALVRLSHVTGTGRARDGLNERSEPVPLRGTPYEQVVFSQVLEVMEDGGGWLALLPVRTG